MAKRHFDTSITENSTFKDLKSCSKLLYHTFLFKANNGGFYNYHIGQLSLDTSLKQNEIMKGLEELDDKGFIFHSESCETIYIYGFCETAGLLNNKLRGVKKNIVECIITNQDIILNNEKIMVNMIPYINIIASDITSNSDQLNEIYNAKWFDFKSSLDESHKAYARLTQGLPKAYSNSNSNSNSSSSSSSESNSSNNSISNNNSSFNDASGSYYNSFDEDASAVAMIENTRKKTIYENRGKPCDNCNAKNKEQCKNEVIYNSKCLNSSVRIEA